MWRIFYRTKRKDMEAEDNGEEYVFLIKVAMVLRGSWHQGISK
jgi:hypothetical protein